MGQGSCSVVLLSCCLRGTPCLVWQKPTRSLSAPYPQQTAWALAALQGEGVGGQDTFGTARTLALQSQRRHTLESLTRTAEAAGGMVSQEKSHLSSDPTPGAQSNGLFLWVVTEAF